MSETRKAAKGRTSNSTSASASSIATADDQRQGNGGKKDSFASEIMKRDVRNEEGGEGAHEQLHKRQRKQHRDRRRSASGQRREEGFLRFRNNEARCPKRGRRRRGARATPQAPAQAASRPPKISVRATAGRRIPSLPK